MKHLIENDHQDNDYYDLWKHFIVLFQMIFKNPTKCRKKLNSEGKQEFYRPSAQTFKCTFYT